MNLPPTQGKSSTFLTLPVLSLHIHFTLIPGNTEREKSNGEIFLKKNILSFFLKMRKGSFISSKNRPFCEKKKKKEVMIDQTAFRIPGMPRYGCVKRER